MVTIEIFSILAYCSLIHGALAAFWNRLSNSNIPSLQLSNNLRSDTRRTVYMVSRLKVSYPSTTSRQLLTTPLPFAGSSGVMFFLDP
jgi:hypothetical protein